MTNVGANEPSRAELLVRGLRLSYISIAWGIASGTVAITSGILAGSLGVLGLGLNVIADVVGSVGLVWRFKIEQTDPDAAERAEARASLLVAVGLSIVAVSLAAAATQELLTRSAPQSSVLAMVTASLSAIFLLPLGLAKHHIGVRIPSRALRGDGTLSCIGSMLGVVALLGLLVNRILHWWWGDRVAALGVAVVAAFEAYRILKQQTKPDSVS